MTATLTASPSNPDGGTDIVLTWAGVPSPDPTDWITIEHNGDPNSFYLDWAYAGQASSLGWSNGKGSGPSEGTSGSATFTSTFFSLLGPGSYTFTLNALGGFGVIATSNVITVTSTNPILTVTPSVVLPGGTVTVAWSQIPSPHSTDWVPFYAVGSSGASYTDWTYATGTKSSGSYSVPGSYSYVMPVTLGDYYFTFNPLASYGLIATSNTVTVASSITSTKTQPGHSRLSLTTTKTQLGHIRITGKATRTQTGHARIAIQATTRTQPGRARVSLKTSRTQTGHAKVNAIATHAQTGRTSVGSISTLSRDTFTDTNGTLLTSHTPDSGPSWTLQGTGTGSQWTISGNQLQRATSSIDQAYINVGQTDMQANATFSTLENLCSVIVRRIDGGNYWELFFDFSNSAWQLNKVVSGVDTALGPLLLGTTGTVSLSAKGNIITAIGPNGTSYTVVDSANSTGTDAALILDGFGGSPSVVDNWGVQTAPVVTTKKTQAGLAEISIIATLRTQTGHARVQIKSARTQLGHARIGIITIRTQPGRARVQSTTVRTHLGRSRVQILTSRTQLGRTRLGLISIKTQSGHARVSKTVTRTIAGHTRVSRLTPQPQTGKAAIRLTNSRTQTARSRIRTIVVKTQLGHARIGLIVQRTHPGKSSIFKTTSHVQNGRAYIGAAATEILRAISVPQSSILRIAGVSVASVKKIAGVSNV